MCAARLVSAQIVKTPFYKRDASRSGFQLALVSIEHPGGIMANVPEDLHYSKDHEWVSVEGDHCRGRHH